MVRCHGRAGRGDKKERGGSGEGECLPRKRRGRKGERPTLARATHLRVEAAAAHRRKSGATCTEAGRNKRGAGREPGATPRGELPENSRQTSSKGSAPAKQRQRAGSPGQPPPPAFFFAPQARRCLPCVGSEWEAVQKRITLGQNVSAKMHYVGSECECQNASRWVGMLVRKRITWRRRGRLRKPVIWQQNKSLHTARPQA